MSKKHQKWLQVISSIQNNMPALLTVVTIVIALVAISATVVVGMALGLVYKVLG